MILSIQTQKEWKQEPGQRCALLDGARILKSGLRDDNSLKIASFYSNLGNKRLYLAIIRSYTEACNTRQTAPGIDAPLKTNVFIKVAVFI